MNILSIHCGGHDSTVAIFNDYQLIAAIQKERLTRRKGDGGFPDQCISEVLSIAGIRRSQINTVVLSRASFPARYIRLPAMKSLYYRASFQYNKKYNDIAKVMNRRKISATSDIFKTSLFLKENNLPEATELFFCNHHYAHALSAFFYTDWDNALLYTADAGGDNVQYSMRIYKNGEIKCLYGGDDTLLVPRSIDSLGLAYTFTTEALGFTPIRHEGKLTGLAAYGEPILYDEFARHFSVSDSGRIFSDFSDYKSMRTEIFRLADSAPRENVAASIQEVLEDFVYLSVNRIIKQYSVDHLALAGGVFANVRLNRKLCEETDIKEIFIFPGMGDEGIVVGGTLQYLLQRDGMAKFLNHRCRVENVYLGRDYTSSIDEVLENDPSIKKISGNSATLAAEMLASNKIGAIYTGRMEFGPRALGARSILANPGDASLNDTLNKRLSRTEFMPFAPYILEEDAEEVFDITNVNRYACRFMTITVNVKEHWRDRIPAVVHIDNTARPQIINKTDNLLYHSILNEFKKNTGLPVLVNTSFNAHEEPIVNRPEECLQALLSQRIDFVVTNNGIYQCN
jgi:carbamoyltransferase